MAEKSKGFGTLAGLAAGAALGAVALALTDKKKRVQLQKLIDDFKKQGTKQFKDVKKKAEEAREQLMEMVKEEKTSKPKTKRTSTKRRTAKSVRSKTKVQ